MACLLSVCCCERRTEPPTEQPPSVDTVTPSPSTSPTQPATEAAPVGGPPSSAWEAAAARGIRAPEASDLTYRIDAFVAATVFEWVRSGADPTFTAWTSDGTEGAPQRGFLVASVPEGSLLHALGLRSGDVIESVAKIPFDQPDVMERALEGAENELSVGIYRDGMSIVHSYRLTGGLAWREILADVRPPQATPATPDATDDAVVADSGSAAEPDRPQTRPSSTAGFGTRPTSGGSAGPSAPRGTPSKPPSSAVAWCESAEKCFVRESFFDAITASPDRLEAHAEIVPAVRNDVFSGYKLKTVKPAGAVAGLGFRAGDKITHVNGRDLTDDAQALQLYISLGSTRVFKIRYERNGQARAKTVLVQ